MVVHDNQTRFGPFPALLRSLLATNDGFSNNFLARYRADSHVSPATTPASLCHTADDERVSARNALLFVMAPAEQGVPYEGHIFDRGAHGRALHRGIGKVARAPTGCALRRVGVKWPTNCNT